MIDLVLINVGVISLSLTSNEEVPRSDTPTVSLEKQKCLSQAVAFLLCAIVDVQFSRKQRTPPGGLKSEKKYILVFYIGGRARQRVFHEAFYEFFT